jgi:hypothetical protein
MKLVMNTERTSPQKTSEENDECPSLPALVRPEAREGNPMTLSAVPFVPPLYGVADLVIAPGEKEKEHRPLSSAISRLDQEVGDTGATGAIFVIVTGTSVRFLPDPAQNFFTHNFSRLIDVENENTTVFPILLGKHCQVLLHHLAFTHRTSNFDELNWDEGEDRLRASNEAFGRSRSAAERLSSRLFVPGAVTELVAPHRRRYRRHRSVASRP